MGSETNWLCECGGIVRWVGPCPNCGKGRARPMPADVQAAVERVRANLCEMTLRCDWGDHTIEPSDIRVLLAAVSRPAEARGEPSEAMCRAAMREFSAQLGEPFESVWEQMGERERGELLDDWRHILRAALAAQRVPTP